MGQTAKESAAVEKQITSTLLPELQVGFEWHVQAAAVCVTYVWTRQNKDWLLRFELGTEIVQADKDKEGKQE